MIDGELKKQYSYFRKDYKNKFGKNRKRIVWEAFVAGYQIGIFDCRFELYEQAKQASVDYGIDVEDELKEILAKLLKIRVVK